MGLITYENLEDGTPVTANIFNERFAQIIAQLNGNLDENNFSDDSISKEKLKAEVYESMYPVGSMYVNFTDNTNPATLLGFGVWSAVEGKMVVGYDAAQTEFNASEKTGGAKVHTLTTAQMPSHNHTGSTSADGNHSHVYNRWSALLQKAVSSYDDTRYIVQGEYGANTSSAGNHTHSFTTSTSGSGNAFSVMNPYVVGYVWKRTS